MRNLILTLAVVTALAAAATPPARAEKPAPYAITVYSGAAPGQLSLDTLANYGANLPGYALVRDHRRMTLEAGQGTLRFTDVARRIDPTTVSFASLTDPAGTRVIEQNFQFDLVSQQKLIERYIGQKITVEQVRGEKIDRIEGTLLSANGGLILQTDQGEVRTLQYYSRVDFPQLPGGLITRPTLVWLVDAARGGEHDTRVSYQTRGMLWWSDYNVVLRENADTCAIDLAAWVTVVNQSGATYNDAQLRLVAGEVHRAPAAGNELGMVQLARRAVREEATLAEGFQESSLSEYHLYTLGRRTDLPDNSTKQLELFPTARGARCRKQLVFTASPQPWTYWGAPISEQGYGATTEGTVGAYLEFDNKDTNRLGMPLPAGRVRVNQAANDGALEFIGEDVIKHTPRNETLRIKLGNAFDVVGERRQMNFVYDDDKDFIDETFEISVRNRKKVAADVTVREYLYRWSNWNITAQSHPSTKRDQQTLDFPLHVPADGEVKLTYTVRYSW